MLKKEVRIGHTYIIKDYAGKMRIVRIKDEHHKRGWYASYVSTGFDTFIRSAAKLRAEAYQCVDCDKWIRAHQPGTCFACTTKRASEGREAYLPFHAN